MTTTKLLTIAVVALLILNMGLVAVLFWKPTQNGPSDGGPKTVISRRLHFDTSQQEQYDKLVDEHRHQTRQLNQAGVRLYRQYYQLLKTNQPDTVRSARFSQEIAANQRAIAELNFAHFSALKALCRPDQQADFTRLVDDLTELFGRNPRPNRRGSPPPGPPENF